MKPLILLSMVCMICVAAVPVMAAGDYMGENIQLGGSGTGITRVTPGATTAAAATGSLSVTTTPAGASIFVDGVRQGTSPATISGLSPGSHTLLLKLDGYQDLSAPVSITAGQTLVYPIELSPGATSLPAVPAATKSPGFEAALGIAALGAVFLVIKTSR